jgi:hypothetical protein
MMWPASPALLDINSVEPNPDAGRKCLCVKFQKWRREDEVIDAMMTCGSRAMKWARAPTRADSFHELLRTVCI